jgi:hypothetical protein
MALMRQPLGGLFGVFGNAFNAPRGGEGSNHEDNQTIVFIMKSYFKPKYDP